MSTPTPTPSPTSHVKTAIAVTAGAVIGSTLIAAAAPVILPVVGLGALVAGGGAAVSIVGGLVGGWMGYKTGGPNGVL